MTKHNRQKTKYNRQRTKDKKTNLLDLAAPEALEEGSHRLAFKTKMTRVRHFS